MCRPTKPGLTCYSCWRIHVSKWTKYSCESRRGWEATGRPTLVHSPPQWGELQATQTQLLQEGELHTESGWQCNEHCPHYHNELYRYVHCAHCTQLLLNFYAGRHSSDLHCSRSVDSMDTLHSFRRGTAAIPGTLWTRLWTMDSSAKADSFAHLQKSFRKSTFQGVHSKHQLRIEFQATGQIEKKNFFFVIR